MQKILVTGSGCAGKSTFSAKLGIKLGLPVLHLDRYFWCAGWVESDKAEWRRTVEHLTAQDAWIMDGNYGGTLDIRLAACDTVIFLDMPRYLCLWRILRRRLRFHGQTRPDVAEGCDEQLTWEFIRYVWHYPTARRPQLLARLSSLRDAKEIIVMRSRSEVEAFLARLAGS